MFVSASLFTNNHKYAENNNNMASSASAGGLGNSSFCSQKIRRLSCLTCFVLELSSIFTFLQNGRTPRLTAAVKDDLCPSDSEIFDVFNRTMWPGVGLACQWQVVLWSWISRSLPESCSQPPAKIWPQFAPKFYTKFPFRGSWCCLIAFCFGAVCLFVC